MELSRFYFGVVAAGMGRLKNWDYRTASAYFVTIVTRRRTHFFGHILDGKMCKNEIGDIADACWRSIPEHIPNVSLREFIIMPDHVHGIVMLNDPDNTDCKVNCSRMQFPFQLAGSSLKGCFIDQDIILNQIPMMKFHAVDQEQLYSVFDSKYFSSIAPLKGSLSVALRSYKSVVTRLARVKEPNFGWQRGFHDRIIRNQAEYDRIARYIISNPKRWKG